MKRPTLLLTALAFALWAIPVFAQHGGGGHAGGGAAGGGIGHGSAKGAGHETSGGKSSGSHSTSSSGKTPSQLLTQNTKLASKLQSLLPAGTDLKTASSGFKNLGQFAASVHVYNNLGLASKTPPVSFSDFAKAVQTGSLGKAIKQFDPTANSTAEAKKGHKQASDDLKETESPT